MKDQKIVNLLDNTPNQPYQFRVKHSVEINDDAHGTYNTNSQIKFETSVLTSILRDFRDAYIFLSRTVEKMQTMQQKLQIEIRNKQYLTIAYRLPNA